MKEYRIVKETTINTNSNKYYIEEKKKLLVWEWWDRKKYCRSHLGLFYETHFTYEEAKCELDKLTDYVIKEVVE